MLCSVLVFLSSGNLLGPSDHLLIQHTPKTGGTSFRSMILRGKPKGKTCQVHYGSGPIDGCPNFDAAHPANVIMGHHVNFHTLQPVAAGHTVRYVTMLRSPYSWFLSLYLHFHPTIDNIKDLDAKLVGFVQNEFSQCEGLKRDSNGTQCHGQLYAWYSGGAPITPDKCLSFAKFFTHPSRLLLVNERYAESMWLLYEMLGWGSPPKVEHTNTRPDAVYDQSMSLRTTSAIATALSESCLPDIYAAARERFEHVYRLARAYCADREPCNLATTELGRRLWTPLTHEGPEMPVGPPVHDVP